MPELNGEAFVPPTCPALNAVVDYRGKKGMIVRPQMMCVNFPDLNYSSHGAGGIGLDVYFSAGAESGNDSADITQELSSFDPESGEGQNVAWLAGLDDDQEEATQLALGEKYCERVKRCGGVILREGKPVCHALDPESLHPIISELRRGENAQ